MSGGGMSRGGGMCDTHQVGRQGDRLGLLLGAFCDFTTLLVTAVNRATSISLVRKRPATTVDSRQTTKVHFSLP